MGKKQSKEKKKRRSIDPPLDFFRPNPSLSITSSAHRMRLELVGEEGAWRRRVSVVVVGRRVLDTEWEDDSVAGTAVVVMVVVALVVVVGWVTLEAAL